jgi:hypothetical protein
MLVFKFQMTNAGTELEVIQKVSGHQTSHATDVKVRRIIYEILNFNQ